MAISLSDIWKIDNIQDYKVHFARRDNVNQPLEVFVRDQREWQGWQEYRPSRNDFNRPYIFSLIQFYHETDTWLFGGVFKVIARHDDRYDVALLDAGAGFTGRLKIHSPYRGRTTRVNLENHYTSFNVQEILRETYSGRQFPGYDNIDLSFEELEALVKNERLDWKAALENVKGVYLISDTSTNKRYVGSAYGDQGIWSRWCNYVLNGHGGNAELRLLVTNPTLAYCRENFRLALLEHRSNRTPDETILIRETFWKRTLLTRRELNRN